MKWLLILAIVLPLSQQPTELPKDKRPAETDRTKSAGYTKGTESNQAQAAQPAPTTTPAAIATESQRSATTANDHARTTSQQTADEDRATQRKLTWFTGVLAAVGVLQLVVMFLTWLIYRRQAHEMRRQRHEMRRQRHVMFRQWKAMGEQAKLMEGQLNEMKSAATQMTQLIEHAGKQAEAALLYAKAIINTERAWLLVHDVVAGGDTMEGDPPRQFTYRIRNYGKTPGKLIGIKAELQVGDDPDFPPDESILFELKGAPAVDFILTPEGTSLARESDTSGFSEDERKAITSGESYLWACGSLHYRDAFAEVRITPFCYQWLVYEQEVGLYAKQSGEFVLARLPGYNTPT
jgi:hypothetical protein